MLSTVGMVATQLSNCIECKLLVLEKKLPKVYAIP